MSDNSPAPAKQKQKIIDASRILRGLEFRTGISAKTGNPYIIGAVYIKTARGRKYSLPLAYLDDNAADTIEDALSAADDSDREEFSAGLL